MFNNVFEKQTVKRALDKGRYDGANNTCGEDFQQQVDHATERSVHTIEREASGPMRRLEAIKAIQQTVWQRHGSALTRSLQRGGGRRCFTASC
jgi:hypothetical protein